MVRSNGILSGFLFAYDASLLAWAALTQGLDLYRARRFAVIVLGGGMVALGMIVPQILAYRIYCMSQDGPRPWCSSVLPSIYGWVQGYYW